MPLPSPARRRRSPGLRPRALAALLCAGALVVVPGRPAAADSPVALPEARPIERPPVKRMHARAVERGPIVDGVLDDPAWQQAHFTSDFAQKQPLEGAAPSRRTEVAIVYDREALYVAARMQSRGPDDIQAVMTRRDDTGSAERIIISLDPFRDRRTAYSFAVTAAGVRADWYHPDDAEFNRDRSFDPVWTAATTIGADGWIAEMRIPFTQLRFVGGTSQRWGININRYIPQRNEDIYWVVVPQSESGWSSRFGVIEGLEDIRQPLRLEILPYLAGHLTMQSSALVAPGDPFARTFGAGGNAGVDVKLGLGPSLTLDATINPDFGQVEADPAQVNLTAYESFFDERRTFFTEGSQLLQGRGPGYFYSRRIGAAPRGSADGDHVDMPGAVPILAAAKLTGRLPSATSVGALAALTPRAFARTHDAATGARDRVAVEPLTGYGVLRVQQELGAEASIVGASLAAVHRDLEPGEPLAGALVDQAFTGGADWNLRFAGGAYELGGYAGFSHLRGEPDAIETVARSSVHYFQRPDQDHVSLDAERRTLSGATAALWVDKRHGTWLWHGEARLMSPGFDLNDVGRLQRADELFVRADLLYRDTAPGRHLHRWEAYFVGLDQWNFGGVRAPLILVPGGNLTWKNFWTTTVETVMFLPGQNDAATRGGPLAGTGWGQETFLSLSGAPGARTRWSGSVVIASHQTGFNGFVARGDLTLRPADRLGISLLPRYRHHSNNRQYVDTQPGDNPATYGNRYVFGTIEYRELALQTRLQVAFTPALAVDLYLEPFAASGRYHTLGELPAPRSRGLAVYGRDLGTIERDGGGYAITIGDERFAVSPDFTEMSLRSTMVLRWELLPGSTMFLVWQQDRSEGLDEAQPVTPLRLGETFANAGGHTLAIKIAYWWPVD